MMWPKSAIVIAFVASACGPATEPQAAAPQEQRAGGNATNTANAASVRLALLEPSQDSDAAGLDGYLHVEGRCLYVTDRGGGGGKVLPAFLIADARWDEELGLLVAHGRSYRPGQHVRLGGSTATDPRLLRWVQPPDPSCDNSSLFVTGMIEALPDGGTAPAISPTGARATQTQLLAALNRHGDAIRRLIPATQGIGIDARNGELVVSVNATGAAAAAVLARDAELETLTGVPIQIRAMSGVDSVGPAPVEETRPSRAARVAATDLVRRGRLR